MKNRYTLKLPEEIIVIGDIHGQKEKLEQILLEAGLIKNNPLLPWEGTDDLKSGRKKMISLGDLVHGEKAYINEGRQLDILYNMMWLQKNINGLSPDGFINNDGPLVVTLGNHEDAELLRVAKMQTMIFKGRIHQGLAPKGVYYLADQLGAWLKNLSLSYQCFGFDFAHAGPFDGTDEYGLNKRIWDRSWYGKTNEVKKEFDKKNILFGFYGHTAYGQDHDSGLAGNAGDVRLAAGGLAAIIDVNRYVTGFIAIKRTEKAWAIHKNIDGREQLIKTIPF